MLRALRKNLGEKLQKKIWDKFAARIIDLDLLLYGNMVIQNDKLKIPDKNIYTRAFVCIPLFELDSNLIIPDTKMPLREIVVLFNKNSIKPLMNFSKELREKIKNPSKPAANIAD